MKNFLHKISNIYIAREREGKDKLENKFLISMVDEC
jgi:hypothetical protein